MSGEPLDIPELRPEPKRDRYGRYLIPDPETGKERGWTRATTFAKSLSDTFGLTKWELRMAALGLAKRSDLLAQVATVVDPDDRDAKRMLDGIVEQAKEAAGSTARRNLGTALHAMTEHLDAGRTFVVPAAHAADLAAYQAATTGLHVDPAHIERIVTVGRYGVAGTFDRLVTLPDGRLVVADLKTGGSLAGRAEWAIQLALYANANTLWDQVAGVHEAMPEVDKTQALVIWLPAGEARCELHMVDIAAGWAMAESCETVRNWRKRRDLSTTYNPTPASDDTTAALTERIAAACAAPDSKAALAAAWPTGVPKKAPWTPEQIAAIEPAIVHAETPAPEPTPPHSLLAATPDDGGPCEHSEREALKARAAELDQPRVHQCAGWRAEGKRGRNPWGGVVDGAWTMRCFADNRAALLCSLHLYDAEDPDALTRAALALVLGQDLQPTWTTGAVIGSLTIEQADQLAAVAEAFGRGDTETCAALGLRITAA